MKKIALTSLMGIVVATAATAGNVISDNPLYRPSEGHFYSVTALEGYAGFDNEKANDYRYWTAGEQMGYGITDKLAVTVETQASASYPQGPVSQDNYSWDNLMVGLNYRLINKGSAKLDVYGKIGQLYTENLGIATTGGLETVAYLWTAGMNAGVVMNDWIVSGTAEYNYWKDDVDGAKIDFSIWKLAMDAQYMMNKEWSVTAGLGYTIVEADDVIAPYAKPLYGNEDIDAKLGVNYNIDSSKYAGIYFAKTLNADYNKDAFAFGAKFGIDF